MTQYRTLRWSLFIATALLGAHLCYADNGAPYAYLSQNDPFYVSRDFPKFITPQWIGEPGVDAVVILSIDDMTHYDKWENFLRPILNRLKTIDGRAPVSIMTRYIDPNVPHLQTWLKEGVSIETHTIKHPCPLLAGNDFPAAKETYDNCIDLISRIPNMQPVAFRMPCCDSLNSPSPRFYANIFSSTTPQGHFLFVDSSVCNITTPNDSALPRDLATDKDGKERFRKYLPFPSFVTTIEDYPYPYVIDRLCWEFPCMVPSDWEAQHVNGVNSPRSVADMEAGIDAAVAKHGVYTLVFHPHGWIRNDQIVELVDHVVNTYGGKVKFLTFKEALDRIQKNVLEGQSLRSHDGGDNGIRLLDLNRDGYLDVVIGNATMRQTRIWQPKTRTWSDTTFPTEIVEPDGNGGQYDAGVRFFSTGQTAHPAFFLRNEKTEGAWRFAGGQWVSTRAYLHGLTLDGLPVFTAHGGIDRGVRFRDINGDGKTELIVSNEGENAIFDWRGIPRKWRRVHWALPDGVSIVDTTGKDNGLRFVDLDGDGDLDIVFSNDNAYGVFLFDSMKKGWATGSLHRRDASQENDPHGIPPIVTDTGNNGAWFHGKTLWFQNETTDKLPDVVDRRPFKNLLALAATR